MTSTPAAPGTAGRVAILRCRDVYELSVRREAEAFAERGYRVDVIQLGGTEAPPGITEENGVTIHRLDGGRKRNASKLKYLADYGQFIKRAARRLNEEHDIWPFDLVQVNTMPDFLYLATLGVKRRGAKISIFMKEPTPELAYTIYGSERVEQAMRLVERSALSYADIAFTVTEELKATYVDRGADPDKIHVVLNCPDIRHLERPDVAPRRDPERFTLLCHGTVEDRYGHDVILDAVKLVKDQIGEIQVRITGSGDHLPAIEQRIIDDKLEDHVASLGWLDMDELVAELRGADAGIVSQRSSPYSNLVHTNKMFEYIMVGIPCIASRLQATANCFDDESLLFFTPDDPASLADAIRRLHAEPELARNLTRSARAKYEAGYRWADQREVLLAASLQLIGA